MGSAGGIGALQVVLGGLPEDLDAAVLVVIHLTPQAPSLLPAILARSTGLRVETAEDGAELVPSVVRVAPPDAHLLVTEDGRLHLDRSRLVHHVRPSADVLLLSLAQNHDGPCAAVILSGTGIDGAAGAAAVKQVGGRVLAQDEATSQYFGMPGAAILAGGVDEVLPLDEIARAVIQWTQSE
ncbi:MAG TPA: chemotaxis protein CheB [Gaiellaceae bacterium]|nr:chemotaxis protein CheB [Gaiellaceae bacterium]